MNITYNYEIIAVDSAAKVMEIVYTSEGRPPVHIGARLPFINETVESILHMYAPIRFWQDQEAPVIVPDIGVTGTVAPSADTDPKELQKSLFINTVQFTLDEFARTRGYDNVNSISKYQNITDEELALLPEVIKAQILKFRTECRYLAVAVASTWAKSYEILSDIESGKRLPPTDMEALLLELPPLEWPI